MWEERLKFYDKLVAGNDKFQRKGKTVPYTSANGYMFSFINKEGDLGIRLPKAVGQQFMETHQATIFKSHGAVMKDYVCIPEHLYEQFDLLADFLDQGYEYVMTLKPK